MYELWGRKVQRYANGHSHSREIVKAMEMESAEQEAEERRPGSNQGLSYCMHYGVRDEGRHEG